ncbi:hypothetical protein BGZ96_004575 [Linnemannia gamsii]|uniref:C2H2-type domain-containing protein n=1 Tax=Linnemannia gamsii TaxID=64522 RepID=A0ABQ7JI16_9FUNG|nr:hypothetical protein BGZ96_004575 [Linnemannia gamsii]
MSSQRNLPELRPSGGAVNGISYQGGKFSSVTLLRSTKERSMDEVTDYLMEPSNIDAPDPSLDLECTQYIGVSGLPLDNNGNGTQGQITVACGNLVCTPISKDPLRWRGDKLGEPSQCLLKMDDQGLYYPAVLNSATMSLAFFIYLAIDLWLNGLESVYRADRSQDMLDLTVLLAEIEMRRFVAPAAITDVNLSSSILEPADTFNIDVDNGFSSEFRDSDTEEDDDIVSLSSEIQSFEQVPAGDHSGTDPEPEPEPIVADASNNNGCTSAIGATFKSKDHGPPGLDPATCDPATHLEPAGTTAPKPKSTKPKSTKPRPTRATETRKRRATNPLTGGTTHPAKLAKKRFHCTYLKCPLDFGTKYSMEVHRTNKHEGVKFKCKVCKKGLASYNILYRHYNRQHQGHSWVCFPCGASRSRKPSPKDLEELGLCTATNPAGVHDFQHFPGPLAVS